VESSAYQTDAKSASVPSARATLRLGERHLHDGRELQHERVVR
jgi:hypothetical protein